MRQLPAKAGSLSSGGPPCPPPLGSAAPTQSGFFYKKSGAPFSFGDSAFFNSFLRFPLILIYFFGAASPSGEGALPLACTGAQQGKRDCIFARWKEGFTASSAALRGRVGCRSSRTRSLSRKIWFGNFGLGYCLPPCRLHGSFTGSHAGMIPGVLSSSDFHFLLLVFALLF